MGGAHEGVLGLPRLPLGRPKWVITIGKTGFGIHYPQNVLFYICYTTFFKNRQIAPGGGSWVRFSRNLGAPGGLGPPRGVRDIFWGSLGTHLGEPVNSGGARGDPREPLFFQGAHLFDLGAPQIMKKTWCFIVFSP